MRTIAALALLSVAVLAGVATVTTPVLTLDGDAYPAADEFGTTDPLAADTDGDGLPDDRETWANLSSTDTDADDDGLED